MITYSIVSPVLLLILDPDNELPDLDAIINKHANLGYAVHRVMRVHPYVIVAEYAALTSEDLVKLFLYNGVVMTPTEIDMPEELNKYQPTYNRACGTYMKGGVADSDSIDSGIAPLVEVINKFPGIKTFASCDGHGVRFADVIWNVSDLNTQEILIMAFDLAFNDVLEKFKYSQENFRVEYHCGMNGKTRQNPGIYFEVRIMYNTNAITYESAMDFIKQSSEKLSSYLDYMEPANA